LFNAGLNLSLLYSIILEMKEIFSKIGQRLFSPPIWGDQDKTLAARQVFSIVRAFLLSATFLQFVQIVITPVFSVRWLLLLLATLAVSLLLLEITRRGHITWAASMLVLSLWLLITIFSWTASGFGARAAWGYFIVVFIAAMLLGRRIGILTAGLCSAATLFIGVTSPIKSPDPARFWLINTLYLAIVLLLQNMASRSIRESLVEAKQQLLEKQQAEEALLVRNQFISSLLRAIPVAVFFKDKDGKYTGCNDAYTGIMGVTSDELKGKTVHEVWPSDLAETYHQKDLELMRSRQHQVYEFQVKDKHGQLRPVIFAKDVFLDSNGDVGGMVGAFLDITDRKQAEEALRESEEKYRLTMDVAPIGIYIIQDLKFKFVNPEMARMHGYTPEEMIGSLSPPDDLVAPEHREMVRQTLLRRQAGVRGQPYEIKAKRRNGSLFDALVWGQGIAYEGKPASIGTLLDISERKHAEEAVRESEQRYHTLFEAASDSIFVMKDNLFFDCNSRTLEMFGCRRDQIIGVSPDLFSPPIQPDGRDSRGKAMEKIDAAYSGIPQFFEWMHSKADGTPFIAEVSLSRFELASGPHLLAIVRDIAGRKVLEEQLRQAQKMEAVGILAGGVAHDFNNILSTIVGYASLLQMQAGLDKKLKDYLERILASTERAASLTHSLLAFSRKQAIELQPVEINDSIFGFHKVLARLIGEDIEFKLNLDSESLVVDADVRQIEQVLMNLATNARDAMPHGGKLTISTRSEVFSEGVGEIPRGAFAVISVADTGTGMNREIQNHLFEPFFTTKEVGKGTGLGLAIVYGIIKNHQGFIKMESDFTRGTTFHLYLPLKPQAVRKSRRRQQARIPQGKETILLVEDDAAVRHVTRSMLEEFGYKVLEAADGQEALEVFAQHCERISLLLSDLIMPKKNGKETRAGIMELKPDIKTIFMSGYTSDIIARKGILDPGIHLLLKPLHPAALLEKIREVLDS